MNRHPKERQCSREKERRDLDVFRTITASNLITDMILDYRISNQVYHRVSIFVCQAFLAYTFFLLLKVVQW